MEIRECTDLELGKQYSKDHLFMAAARLHQSEYRRTVLKVGFEEYGNMLTEIDGRNLLNYYGFLDVRDRLRERYPAYSKMRDANMLRSEHIPFNMFAPFINRTELARQVYQSAFDIEIQRVLSTSIEFAPEPKSEFLNDGTSFDVYVEYLDQNGDKSALGIEVKYTEHAYQIGEREKRSVEDPNSMYWKLTSSSGIFIDEGKESLASDKLRQIWRNHLLGLAMRSKGFVRSFISMTVYPSGNAHFTDAIAEYRQRLHQHGLQSVQACTFERFIAAITGGEEILKWKDYLHKRYIVSN